MDTNENQYTNWVYPLPIEDMRIAIADGSYWEIGDPLLYHPLFWPHKRNVEKLDILIAGCGSVQAAYYACRNPGWNVIGIDLSENSLAHQQKLKDRHGLSNLRLAKLDIMEVPKLGEDFDFIVSTGVLHHLEEPESGLTALREVLRPEGVMNLMVYGKSLRVGVYMLQEVFRLLNLQQTQEDVDIVKATIEVLPQEHVVHNYIRKANDLGSDAAYVDTFLHRRDRAYDVCEVYELTRKAGLAFLSWCDPGEYSPDSILPSSHPLRKRLLDLSPETLAHVCDLLTQSRGTHRWAAGHPEYIEKARIPFETSAFYDCIVIPHRSTQVVRKGDHSMQQNVICLRGGRSYELAIPLAEIISRTKGAKSIRQVISEMNLPAEEEQRVLLLAKDRFRTLWQQGDIYILLPEKMSPK